MTTEESQKALKELYNKAIREMPRDTSLIIFWSGVLLSEQMKQQFENAIDEMTNYADWIYTHNVWTNGYFNQLAIRPDMIKEQDIDSILGRWIATPEEIRVEYRGFGVESQM